MPQLSVVSKEEGSTLWNILARSVVTYPHNWGHIPCARDVDDVQHLRNRRSSFEAFCFPGIKDPQTNRCEMDVRMDHEQLSVTL